MEEDEEEIVRKKLKELQVYVPLLTALIEDAAKTKNTKELVVTKMHHLRYVLTAPNSKPKLPLLLQCEALLSNLRKNKLAKKSISPAETSRNTAGPSGSSERSSEAVASTSSAVSSSSSEVSQPVVSSSSNVERTRNVSSFSGVERTEHGDPRRSRSDQRRNSSGGRDRPDSSTDRTGNRRDSVELVSPERINPPRTVQPVIDVDDSEIYIEKEVLAPRKSSGRAAECETDTPRSPSPPPQTDDLPREKHSPKLIPHEPVSSILSLPMPPSAEDDLQVSGIALRPQDPRPKCSKHILKSREKLQKLVEKISIREKSSQADKAKPSTSTSAAAPKIASAQNFTMVGQMTSQFNRPVTVKDYGHGSASSSVFDEPVYSPEDMDFGKDGEDLDDENVEERVSPPPAATDVQKPSALPDMPNFDLPLPSSTAILSTDDLESLVTNISTRVPPPERSPQLQPKPKLPEARPIPKVDDFIPARGVLNRVPSHIMAGKGRSSEAPKPSEAMSSRDPRKKGSAVAPPPLLSTPPFSPTSSLTRPPELLSRPVPPAPLWGVSNLSHPPPPPQQPPFQLGSQPQPLLSGLPPISLPPISLPPIVTPDGQPIPNRYNNPIPVLGNYHPQQFSQHQFQHRPPQQFHHQFGPSSYQQQPSVPKTYAEHRAIRAAEEEAKRKAEMERKAREAAEKKAAAQASSLKKATGSVATKKHNIPLNMKPPFKKPLTQLIDAQPLPQHITSTIKKKPESKSKVNEEKAKVDTKAKDDKSKEIKGKPDEKTKEVKGKVDDKVKPGTSKSLPSKTSDKKLPERRNSNDNKKVDSKSRHSSTERKAPEPPRRPSFDEALEKHVGKSLEKVSPLGSLYGEMPGPRVGLGYGPQVFRIPKKPKKRTPTPPPREETPEPMEEEQQEEEEEEEEEEEQDVEGEPEESEMEVPEPEVENQAEEIEESTKEATCEVPVAAPVSSTSEIAAPPPPTQSPQAIIEKLTQEQIEIYIRKSFESGEAKKLLDERTKIFPLLQKIKDPKKLAKIRKLIESDSESEEEETDKETEKKKKKEKVVATKSKESSSDSSDDEPLARKMTKPKESVIKSDSEDEANDSDDTLPAPEPLEPIESLEPIEPQELIEPQAEEVPVPMEETKPEEQIEEQKPVEVKVKEEEPIVCLEKIPIVSLEKISPPKRRFRRRNSLDRLHDDIREMFISEGVLAATGSRNVKPVIYTNSFPEFTKGRKCKKDIDYEPKKGKRESLDSSISSEEVVELVQEPLKEEIPELPKLYVRLERISTPIPDEEGSRSCTPTSSGRGSQSSYRNVARRGKRVGPNFGTREPPAGEDESQQLDVGEPADEMYTEQTESVSETNIADTEAETESNIADTVAETESAPVKATAASRRGKGRRGRKSAWQKGVTTSKKSTGRKANQYEERFGEDLTNTRYHFSEDSVNIKCLLCMYEGKKIVDHYLTHHPNEEVLISRISQEEFKHAQQQPPNVPPPAMVMTCRFCAKEELHIESLYDHVTEHTGEYRYKCPKCDNFVKCSKKTVLYHINRTHPEIAYPQPIELTDAPHIDSTFLPGYVCGYCRYTQLNKASIEKHIERFHRSEKGAACPPGLEEVNEINLAKWAQDIPDANNSLLDMQSQAGIIIPKAEMNVDYAPAAPLDLPTLSRYEETPPVDPLGISIKKEPQEEILQPSNVMPVIKTEQEDKEADTNENLENMDIHATLQTLEQLLHEAPNNPKVLLESIRNNRYDSVDDLPPSSVPEAAVAKNTAKQDTAVPSCSATKSIALTQPITEPGDEDTSSEDEDISLGRTATKQPNLLKPDLLDKIRNIIGNTTCLNNEDTASSEPYISSSTDTGPKKKRKLDYDIYQCYVCALTNMTFNVLIEHIKSSHPPHSSGCCPECLFPLANRDIAVEHIWQFHKPTQEPPTSVQRVVEPDISPKSLLRLKPISQLLASQTAGPRVPQVGGDVIQQQSSAVPAAQQDRGNMSRIVKMQLQSGTLQSLPSGSRVVIGPGTFVTPQEKSAGPGVSSKPSSLNMAPAPLYAKTIKEKIVYDSMLTVERLRRQYKCLGISCNFSTDNQKRFIRHFNQHAYSLNKYPNDPQNAAVAPDSEDSDGEKCLPSWTQCAYCCRAFKSASLLVNHIVQVHNNCVYQCAVCFYRSASKSNVTLHQTQSHPGKPQILMCSDKEPPIDAAVPSQNNLLGNLVMPYICTQGVCGHRQFYNRDIFAKHLKMEHNTAPFFQCHVCCTSYASPDLLLEHYKTHSYNEFQCMICRHGTDTQVEMHCHLYVEHPNYTACLLVRSLIGAKNQKNVLQGALRRLEMANITVVNVPKDPEDDKDPDDSETEDEPPTLLPIEVTPPPSTQNEPGRNLADDNSYSQTESNADMYEELDSVMTRSRSSSSASSVRNEQDDEGQDNNQEELDGHKLFVCCNKGCETTYETADDLSEHLMVCDMTRASTALCCVHCSRTFRQVPGLIDHLRNMHGPKRFTCGVCDDDFRVTTVASMYRHFKSKHKTVATVLKPVDPLKNNPEQDKFIVLPKPSSPQKATPKKVLKPNMYSPNDIDSLPKQPIYQTHVHCSECNFSDRVRTNMIRHLKSHIEENKEVTKAIPINPMPCLESRERHFDKMTNWAGSSHKNQDGTPKPPPKRRSGIDLSSGELEKLPRFIPASRRYVCGADSCEYLTTDLEMLTLHVKNLHAEDSVYICPHCPDLETLPGPGTLFERGLSHLRLHGDRLYRCSVCQYHHHARKVVERHLAEKHEESPDCVLIIREPDTPEVENPVQIPTWLCSECGFTTPSFEEIKTHCKTEHNIKSQYRCSLCNIRAAGISSIEQHFTNKHPGENILMYASYYRSDLSDNRIIIGVPTVEVRGEVIQPVPVQPSAYQAAAVEKVKLIRQILVEEVESPLTKAAPAAIVSQKEETKRRASKEGAEAELIMKYGPLGEPIRHLYSCPLCKKYKNKFKHNLRDHLYHEFNYRKYICKQCGLNTANKANLQRHLQRYHNIDRDFVKYMKNRKDNPQLESWVARVVSHQNEQIADFITTNGVQPQPQTKAVAAKTTPQSKTVTPKTTPTKQVTPVTPPKVLEPNKSVLRSPALRQSSRSLLKPRPVEVEDKDPLSVDQPSIRTTIDLDDDEERPLIIEEDVTMEDNDEDSEEVARLCSADLLTDNMNHKPAPKSKKNKGQFKCRHCSRSFKLVHGLKMHIKLYHYRLGKFKCGYCTVSMNSEQLLLQHCRVAHPNLPEVTVENTNKVVLDDHFWEQEYGLKRGKDSTAPSMSSVVPPTSSVSAPASSVAPPTLSVAPPTVTTPSSSLKKCQYCDYTTGLTTTLKRHEMRHWVQKPFECGYCKLKGLAEFYIRKHCERVHPDLPIKVIENSMPSKPDIKPLTRTRKSTQNNNDAQEGENNDAHEGENNHDVEVLDEEVRDPESATKESSILYRCFYCSLKSVKLLYIHTHWRNKHRNEENSLPFRYKAIPISQVILGKDSGDDDEDIQKFCCAYCKFKGPMSNLNSHFTEWHPGKDFKVLDLKQSSFRCIHCSYVSIYLHILKEHIESEHSGLEFGYQVFHKSKTVRALGENSNPLQIPTASSKFQCLWCQEMCENKEKMDLHNTCFHSHLEPKFKAVDSSEVVVDVADDVAKPSAPSNKPQKAINPNRRLYLCPDCPNKTMTLRVMRAHVSRMHIKEYECPYCSIVLEDFRAAHMHMVVEHPGVDRSKNLIPKSKEKIDHKMLFVKREGDDDEKDTGIPEFCEINITDILSKSQSTSNDPQSPPLIPIIHSNPLQPVPEESPINEESSPPVKRRRCVAKKSTAKPAKNTARKSFPSSSWIPPLLMIESEPYSSTEEEESDDDEGQSWYVHPSAREPLPSLTSMSHLRTELSVNSTSTIPVTVDKLAMLMNLVPQVIITDCSPL